MNVSGRVCVYSDMHWDVLICVFMGVFGIEWVYLYACVLVHSYGCVLLNPYVCIRIFFICVSE